MNSLLYFPTGLIWLALGLAVSLGINLAAKRVSYSTRHSLCIGYRLIIPYWGLLVGAVSPYLMGLSNINWETTLGIGAGLSFAIIMILALINITLSSGQSHIAEDQSKIQPGFITHNSLPTDITSPFASRHLSNGAAASVAEQFYWAFVRATIWEFLLRLEPQIQLPAYHALWLTGLIALPDMLMHTKNQQNRITKLCIFIATSIVFFFTHNFWLCALLHLSIAFLMRPVSTMPVSAIEKSRSQSLPQIEARTQ